MTRYLRSAPPRRLVAAGLALVALVAAGCGGSSPGTRRTAESTTTTLSPAAAAVLSAYRASQVAFDQAVGRADPTWPELAQTMTGAELESVRRSLVADQANGVVGRGSVQVFPKIVSIAAGRAVVHDCVYSTSELVYAKTGQPVPPVTPPEHDGVTATLQMVVPGTWKVADEQVTQGHCPSGY